MCTVGALAEAGACTACAGRISPPSTVTAALLDMICGLKGRTARPRAWKARASPATISDLPTSEPVPWNMMAAGRLMAWANNCPSEFDPGLGLHAVAERMLHHRHLGHQIGCADQLFRR